MKRIILMGLVLLMGCQSFGQVNYTQFDHDKNWFQRYRLVNQFLKIGDGYGMSIPAGSRSRNGSPKLSYCDGTIYHGWYLGMLATEYRLLKNQGQLAALEKTKIELCYSLKAMLRLDYYGTCSPQYGYICSYDRFFLRNDSLIDFLDQTDNYTHFNSMNEYFGHDEVTQI